MLRLRRATTGRRTELDSESKGEASAISAFESFLHRKFGCDQPEDANFFCGITITQETSKGLRRISLSQSRFVDQLVKEFHVSPCAVEYPLLDYLEPAGELHTPDPKCPFRQPLGSLMYVMIATRPDIAFAIHHLSRFGQNYTSDHHAALCRLLQYVHHTSENTLTYTQTEQPELVGYSDANWAGCPYTRRSSSP